MPQLQRVHEVVLGRDVDKSEFRTRMLAAGFLEPVGGAPSDSKRAPMGYRLKERFGPTVFPRTFSPRGLGGPPNGRSGVRTHNGGCMEPRIGLLSDKVDVFVAYATPDLEVVRRLVDALRALGWSTFWDQDLFVSDDWTLVLPEALRRARVVAVMVSARYNGALYLRDEVVVAIRRYRADPTRRVVPVLLGTRADLEVADPYGLSVLNPVDHADAAAPIDRLLRALART